MPQAAAAAAPKAPSVARLWAPPAFGESRLTPARCLPGGRPAHQQVSKGLAALLPARLPGPSQIPAAPTQLHASVPLGAAALAPVRVPDPRAMLQGRLRAGLFVPGTGTEAPVLQLPYCAVLCCPRLSKTVSICTHVSREAASVHLHRVGLMSIVISTEPPSCSKSIPAMSWFYFIFHILPH